MWYSLMLAGVVGGLIGGLGMGGGTMLIPLLTMCMGIGQLQAQAINLISFAPMALLSLVVLIKNKLVDFKSMLIVTPIAIIGCVVGAIYSEKIDQTVLRKTFGAFMLCLGVIFMIKAIIGAVGCLVQMHPQGKVSKNRQKHSKTSYN